MPTALIFLHALCMQRVKFQVKLKRLRRIFLLYARNSTHPHVTVVSLGVSEVQVPNCPCGLQKLLTFLFVLLSWSSLLQLLSRVPRPDARPKMMSLPSYHLPLSISSGPYQLLIVLIFLFMDPTYLTLYSN